MVSKLYPFGLRGCELDGVPNNKRQSHEADLALVWAK